MFCTGCGAQVEDGIAFCTSCGAPMKGTGFQQTVAMPQAAQATAQTSAAGPVSPQTPHQHDDQRRKFIIIASVLAAVIVALVIVVVAIVFNKQEQKRLSPRPIAVSISAAGYSDDSTKIPVNANGTDSKGNPVETTVFIDSFGEGAALAPGEYELSFPASPLTTDGILYIPPSVTATIIIDEGSEQDETTSAFEGAPATFTKSTALDETDQMIETAYDYAIKDESQIDKADELKQTAVNAHQQAVNAENERKEREAARTIDMPLYTVKIPEYWVGKVDIIKDGNSLQINAKGYSDSALLHVGATYAPGAEYPDAMGDIGTSVMQYVNAPNGYFVELSARRWTFTAAAEAHSTFPPRYSDAQLQTCIDLQTGGSVTLAECKRFSPASSETNSITFAVDRYINNNVILTAKNGQVAKKATEDYY